MYDPGEIRITIIVSTTTISDQKGPCRRFW